ncbi:hypothetical protein HanHA300_Chr08g0290131 [Helianthus annuus]|nr:hypothetical protein HanHA300_Chr08g0290131 [Helianthus annuus]
MAPSSPPPPYYAITIITIILTLACTRNPKVQAAFKAPILPQDLLPLLPTQISWPILRTLRSATDILPTFVGAASLSNNSDVNWKGSCFYENTAWLELHNKTGSEFGGGTLHIKDFNSCMFWHVGYWFLDFLNWLCDVYYLFIDDYVIVKVQRLMVFCFRLCLITLS